MPAPILRSNQISDFADLWYNARKSAATAIPLKTDIPLRQLAPLMPKMALLRRDAEGVLRYNLFGTQLAVEFGQDLTGTAANFYMDEATTVRALAEFEAFFEKHGSDALWARWTFSTARSTTGRYVEYESLALPYVEKGNQDRRHMMLSLPLTTLEYGEALDPCLIEHESAIFQPEGIRPNWLDHGEIHNV